MIKYEEMLPFTDDFSVHVCLHQLLRGSWICPTTGDSSSRSDLLGHILAQSLCVNILRTLQKSIHFMCIFPFQTIKLRFHVRIEAVGTHYSLLMQSSGTAATYVSSNQPSCRLFSMPGGNSSRQDVMSSGHGPTQH